ncbi:MAG TPA: J domain-containing protein, partial [Patescibacteria group bacterium]|nr:J domain-containing protein [Patescibacteria group bacterium]
MRDQPQPLGDPYRVLGLEPGAPMAEVKRAYRRLAKAYHPDSAGEAALPRFLAIHEAYERLVSGRSRTGAGPRTPRPAPPPSQEPWRADPERARAARERARKGRSSTGTRSEPGSGGNRSRTGTTGTSSGSTGTSSGSTGTPGSGAREGRRRNVRKATLGSTSYDEAREPTDATWSGASWYGPSSGEYWIVNPREYADPRKHGPGYQQRARRSATGEAGTDAGALEDEAEGGAAGSVAQGVAAEDRRTPAPPRAGATGAATGATGGANGAPDSSAAPAQDRDAGPWRSSARRDWAAAGAVTPERSAGEATRVARVDAAMPGDAAPRAPMQSIAAAGRELLGASADDPIRRLGLALV